MVRNGLGTSLVVQWPRLGTPNAGGPGSIPGEGTRSHMPQLKISPAATKTRKISPAATKTRSSQIYKYDSVRLKVQSWMPSMRELWGPVPRSQAWGFVPRPQTRSPAPRSPPELTEPHSNRCQSTPILPGQLPDPMLSKNAHLGTHSIVP